MARLLDQLYLAKSTNIQTCETLPIWLCKSSVFFCSLRPFVFVILLPKFHSFYGNNSCHLKRDETIHATSVRVLFQTMNNHPFNSILQLAPCYANRVKKSMFSMLMLPISSSDFFRLEFCCDYIWHSPRLNSPSYRRSNGVQARIPFQWPSFMIMSVIHLSLRFFSNR